MRKRILIIEVPDSTAAIPCYSCRDCWDGEDARCVPQPAVSGCNKMRSRSSRSFSDHVQTHPVVERAARSAITTMAVRIKVMASSAMSLAV